MRLRAVEQVTAQVDHFHGVLLGGSWLLRFVSPRRWREGPAGQASPTDFHNIPICYSYKAREKEANSRRLMSVPARRDVAYWHFSDMARCPI